MNTQSLTEIMTQATCLSSAGKKGFQSEALPTIEQFGGDLPGSRITKQ